MTDDNHIFNPVEAIADAWASIDGNLDDFRAGKGKPIQEEPGGRYSGYMADASALVERLGKRGWFLTPYMRNPSPTPPKETWGDLVERVGLDGNAWENMVIPKSVISYKPMECPQCGTPIPIDEIHGKDFIDVRCGDAFVNDPSLYPNACRMEFRVERHEGGEFSIGPLVDEIIYEFAEFNMIDDEEMDEYRLRIESYLKTIAESDNSSVIQNANKNIQLILGNLSCQVTETTFNAFRNEYDGMLP